MKKNYKKNLQKSLSLLAVILSLFVAELTGQTSYTFTSCGQTGPIGPSQAQINSSYFATNLNGSVNVTGGIQNFTVPVSALYRIVAAGGSGGGSNSGFGCRGRVVQADFNLTAGQVLKILVGQQGQDGTNVAKSAGGGGGSYVTTLGNLAYVVAGGGGGYHLPLTASVPVSDAPFTNNGNNSLCNSGVGGLNSAGGTGSSNGWGGGGGGFSTNGTNAINCSFTGGRAFVNGGNGGGTCNNTSGGFGGGGGTHGNTGGGGGGGGYSGGGGSNQNINPNAGGGGGSYVALGGTNIADLGLNFGNGYVIITSLCNLAAMPTNTTPPANQIICSSGITTLGVSATGTVNWYSSPSSTVSLFTGLSYVTPALTAGNLTFYAEATNTCGPSARVPITVTVNITPTITLNNGSICSGNSFTILPSGALSYTPSGGSMTVSPLASTAYTVVGTGATGCTNSAISFVFVNSSPTIVVNSGAVCLGQSFTLTPAGAATYTFQGGSNVVYPTANTSYTVIGTSNLGCVSQSFGISNVTVVPSPTISVNSGSICSGNSFLMVPTGAFTYTYSGGSANVSPTVNSLYFVTGTSAQGCVGSNIAICSVAVFPSPTLNAVSSNVNFCPGESATIIATGAFSYSWNTAATSATIFVSPTVTTNYTVTGTAPNGCSSSYVITQSVSACTGIASVEKAGFTIYPNPNNGNFTISFDTDIQLSIINELGQVVKSVLPDWNNGGHVTVAGIPNGIYFIFGKSDGQIIKQKMIIEK